MIGVIKQANNGIKIWEGMSICFVGVIVFLIGPKISIFESLKNAIELIRERFNTNQKFKQIFDNIDECIIIINKHNSSIEYVNSKFMKVFKEDILQVWSKCEISMDDEVP